SNPISTNLLTAKKIDPSIKSIGSGTPFDDNIKHLKKYMKNNSNIERNSDEPLDFYFQYGGVNNFSWVTKAIFGGNSYYSKLMEDTNDLMNEKYANRGFNFYLLKKYRSYCINNTDTIKDFIPEFHNYFNYDVKTPFWEFTLNIDNGYKIVDKQLTHFIADYIGDNPNNHYNINMTNLYNDQPIIQGLPKNAIIEVPILLKNQEIQPVDVVKLNEDIISIIKPYCIQQEQIVEAALGNDINLVIKAMQNEPMNKWIEDEDKIEYLTKLMLFYEKQWLPKDWAEWIPSENELKENDWWISQSDLIKTNEQYLKKKFPIKENLRNKAFFYEEL
ncbi:MAG: hypothetical protein JXA99_00010, partial [Candidatus Lokiarchaeota archaeon]|nr:hypothetical protein [Candidatus Lokiarchaeota archaeon]